MSVLLATYLSLRDRVGEPWRGRWRADRGDVPGWVLITVMTAGLVSVLWFAAGDRLGALLDGALNTVAPASGP